MSNLHFTLIIYVLFIISAILGKLFSVAFDQLVKLNKTSYKSVECKHHLLFLRSRYDKKHILRLSLVNEWVNNINIVLITALFIFSMIVQSTESFGMIAFFTMIYFGYIFILAIWCFIYLIIIGQRREKVDPYQVLSQYEDKISADKQDFFASTAYIKLKDKTDTMGLRLVDDISIIHRILRVPRVGAFMTYTVYMVLQICDMNNKTIKELKLMMMDCGPFDKGPLIFNWAHDPKNIKRIERLIEKLDKL